MYYEKPKTTAEVIAPVDMDNGGTGNVEAGEGENNANKVVKEQDETEDDDDEAIETGTESGVTRSGRVITKPTRLIEEMGALASNDIGLSSAEEKYYDTMWKMSEMAFVGAGIGGGFVDTNELHVMKYKQAMASKDALKWEVAVEEEHECMLMHKVREPVPIEELPEGSKVLTSTWAMKKKGTGRTAHA
jgi:hypothetical protein